MNFAANTGLFADLFRYFFDPRAVLMYIIILRYSYELRWQPEHLVVNMFPGTDGNS